MEIGEVNLTFSGVLDQITWKVIPYLRLRWRFNRLLI